jgi:hypothetical protein
MELQRMDERSKATIALRCYIVLSDAYLRARGSIGRPAIHNQTWMSAVAAH